MAFLQTKNRTPKCVTVILLFLSSFGPVLAEFGNTEASHWSNDIPPFYHRLFFSEGETELRAHLKGYTGVLNALPGRGTTSLQVCNGKALVMSFFLDKNLVSCRLETDPVEIAEFYRRLTDDFNCAEQKKAETFISTRNDFWEPQEELLSSRSLRERSRRQSESNLKNLSGESSSSREDETVFSGESDEVDEILRSGAAREPPWCSIEDALGRQILNETFSLLVNGSEQRELIQEIKKLLQFREQRRQCRFLQKIMRQNAAKKDSKRRHDFNGNEEDEDYSDLEAVLSESSLNPRRAKRSLFSSVLPGTKWCGSGNFAKSFNDLGTSAKTDDCCREHDQCPYTLVSFERRWGLRNKGFFTLSHCRCDERGGMHFGVLAGYARAGLQDDCKRCAQWASTSRYECFPVVPIMHVKFRSCLKMARTSQSRFVGRMFFDILSKQCFVFKKVRRCARLSWDGSRCIRKKWGKKAIIRDGMSYH